jgi:hypothetical protein
MPWQGQIAEKIGVQSYGHYGNTSSTQVDKPSSVSSRQKENRLFIGSPMNRRLSWFFEAGREIASTLPV